ncbi:MAG: hypothetical protein KJ607_00525 [Bacteroidetes bacterium]|nr:hypothetical protein [Bacteroidota bacterium]
MKTIRFVMAIAVLLFVTGLSLCAQNSTFREDEKATPEPHKQRIEIYFIPDGITDELHAERIKEMVEDNEAFDECSIHPGEKSKIVANRRVDTQYLIDMLSEEGVSIVNDYALFLTEGNGEIQKTQVYRKPESFPKMINTGDPKEDERKYAEEIEKWKDEHPMEWKKMLESRRNRSQ